MKLLVNPCKANPSSNPSKIEIQHFYWIICILICSISCNTYKRIPVYEDYGEHLKLNVQSIKTNYISSNDSLKQSYFLIPNENQKGTIVSEDKIVRLKTQLQLTVSPNLVIWKDNDIKIDVPIAYPFVRYLKIELNPMSTNNVLLSDFKLLQFTPDCSNISNQSGCYQTYSYLNNNSAIIEISNTQDVNIYGMIDIEFETIFLFDSNLMNNSNWNDLISNELISSTIKYDYVVDMSKAGKLDKEKSSKYYLYKHNIIDTIQSNLFEIKTYYLYCGYSIITYRGGILVQGSQHIISEKKTKIEISLNEFHRPEDPVIVDQEKLYLNNKILTYGQLSKRDCLLNIQPNDYNQK